MKKLLLLATVFAAVASAEAQIYAPQTLTVMAPIAQSATSTSNSVIYCQKQKDVAVCIGFKLSGAGTSAQTLTFERSVDGVSWETLAASKTVVGIAGTGATESITVTNIPSNGAGFIRLATWANGQADRTCTNTVLSYAVKIGAP
jgi:hypothetical protein